MDYISQMEKLFNFLEAKYALKNQYFLKYLMKRFNNDLNLFGCFVKDFLTIKNNFKQPDDESLYDNFVSLYEKEDLDKILSELDNYSKYYLSIVFEDTSDEKLLFTITTINACYSLESYPYVMKLMNDYNNGLIDKILYFSQLHLITDTVLHNFEFPDNPVSFNHSKIIKKVAI